jgi:hypothetical protein
MVKISVNINKKLFDRAPKAFMDAYRKGLADLANFAHSKWKEVANQNLNTTAADYTRSLQKPTKVDDDTFIIELKSGDDKKNWLVTAIEAGIGRYSIKDNLLGPNSPAAWVYPSTSVNAGKPKVGAPWLDVPFKDKGGPVRFVRLSKKSVGRFNWEHPGFQPEGGPSQYTNRDLGTPFREVVIEALKEKAKEVFKPLLENVKL